jgi:hypothetical protein
MGDTRNAYKISVGETEQKIPLGIPRNRWEHNIKFYLKRNRM